MSILDAGNLPSLAYAIGDDICQFCGRLGFCFKAVDRPDGKICEPCSLLVAWVWRRMQGLAFPEVAYPTEPSFVLVLILREPPDLQHSTSPFEFLMVERKDEPGYFGFPGGKVERGETAEEAVLRELFEETGCASWPCALEPLYTGFSPRARLGRVYLARAYAGVPQSREGMKVQWKAGAPADHVGHLRGYYVGVLEAIRARKLLQTKSMASVPLTVFFDEPAAHWLTGALAEMQGEPPSRLKASYYHAMSPDEREMAETLLQIAERQSGSRSALLPAPPAEGEEATSEEDDRDLSASAEEDSSPDEFVGGETTEPGFVRPPMPRKPAKPSKDE